MEQNLVLVAYPTSFYNAAYMLAVVISTDNYYSKVTITASSVQYVTS